MHLMKTSVIIKWKQALAAALLSRVSNLSAFFTLTLCLSAWWHEGLDTIVREVSFEKQQ